VDTTGWPPGDYVLRPDAKSAARVVYDYFGGKARFPNVSDEMMEAVDKADSAGFSYEDVLNPRGWELLSFLMDHGRFGPPGLFGGKAGPLVAGPAREGPAKFAHGPTRISLS